MAKELNLRLDDDNIVNLNFEDSKGEVIHTIQLDISDTEVPVRFAELINNLEKISEDVEAEEKVLNKKYKDTDSKEFDYNRTIDISAFHTKSLNRILDEIDTTFGEGTVSGVFAEHIDINPDYIPDEYAIIDFIDKLVPVINNLYSERFELKKKKYNVTRRGGKRHNLTKEELIQRQMGK